MISPGRAGESLYRLLKLQSSEKAEKVICSSRTLSLSRVKMLLAVALAPYPGTSLSSPSKMSPLLSRSYLCKQPQNKL